MMKKIVLITLMVFLTMMLSGCTGIGGSPPQFREQITQFDAALARYKEGMNLYSSGDYEKARQAFVGAVAMFKDCDAAYREIARQNLTPMEKKISGNMAGCSIQYAYAAAYMRDASAAALKGDTSGAYVMESSAEEYDLVARQGYESNKAAMLDMWAKSP